MLLPQQVLQDAVAEYRRHGNTEFNRNDLIPIIARLVGDARRAQSLDVVEQFDRQHANLIIDRIERDEDRRGSRKLKGFFSHDEVVKLGEGQRIRRGKMTGEHLPRYEAVIQKNKEGQDRAYAEQIEWIAKAKSALLGRPPSTVVEEVIDESGNRTR